MQYPSCPGFSHEDKRRTSACFTKPKPEEKHKWKENKWDTNTLIGLNVSHILLTQETFVLFFSSGNVVEAVVLPASGFLERCFTNSFWTPAKGVSLDFSSMHITQVPGHPLRCLGCKGMGAGTEGHIIKDRGPYRTKARLHQRKKNARGKI